MGANRHSLAETMSSFWANFAAMGIQTDWFADWNACSPKKLKAIILAEKLK